MDTKVHARCLKSGLPTSYTRTRLENKECPGCNGALASKTHQALSGQLNVRKLYSALGPVARRYWGADILTCGEPATGPLSVEVAPAAQAEIVD